MGKNRYHQQGAQLESLLHNSRRQQFHAEQNFGKVTRMEQNTMPTTVVSLNVEELSKIHAKVHDMREGLYDVMKEYMAFEEDVPIYGKVTKTEKVGQEVAINFRWFAPWEWHKVGQTKIIQVDMPVEGTDVVGTERRLVYRKPDNLDDILPIVVGRVSEYIGALKDYSANMAKLNSEIDGIANYHQSLAEDYTNRLGELFAGYDQLTDALQHCEEGKQELREKLKEGFNSRTIASYDRLDLKIHALAGSMDRLENTLGRFSAFREVFLNTAKVYTATSNTCGTLVDYLQEVSEATENLMQGPIEMDQFVNKISYAVEAVSRLGKDTRNIFSYTKSVVDQINGEGLPVNADYNQNIVQIAQDSASHANQYLSELEATQQSILDVKNSLVESYSTENDRRYATNTSSTQAGIPSFAQNAINRK